NSSNPERPRQATTGVSKTRPQPPNHMILRELDKLFWRGALVSRGQAVHFRLDTLLQVLVLHVLRQGVEAVRVLDRVAADDLADAMLRLSGPVLAGERGWPL